MLLEITATERGFLKATDCQDRVPFPNVVDVNLAAPLSAMTQCQWIASLQMLRVTNVFEPRSEKKRPLALLNRVLVLRSIVVTLLGISLPK